MINASRRTSYKSSGKAAKDADQAEVVAIDKGSARDADGLTDESLAGVPMVEESEIPHNPGGNAEWMDDDAVVEVATGRVADEFLRRARLLGPQYPFDLSEDGSQLTYRPDRSRSGAYEYCLALCETRNDIAANPCCLAVREFERFVGRAFTGHFGRGSEWHRLGVRTEPQDNRPQRLSEAITNLGRLTGGEWEFTPRDKHSAQAEQGDGGIDVVIWKRFGPQDDRIGLPFALVQCGCGEDALQEDKWQSLQLETFQNKYGVRIASAVGGILRCFALPFHVPHSIRWRTAQNAGGIVLDRVRLTWMAEEYLDGAAERHRLQPHTDSLLSPLVHRKKPPTTPAKPAAKRRRPSPTAAGRRSPPE